MALKLSGVTMGDITGGPSSLNLSDLHDVSIVSPVTSQYLRYNSVISEWQNAYLNTDVYNYLSSNLTSSNGVTLTKLSGPQTIDVSLSLTASGDATGSVSSGNLPLTLATVNSNVGTYGSGTTIPVVTVNAKGLVTGVSTVTFSGTSPLATSLSGGSAGAVPYQSAPSVTAFLNAGSTNQVLISGTTPSWTNAPTLTGTNFTGIPNAGLTNSAITLGSTSMSLGTTTTTIVGLTSVTSTTFNGALTGNATTATTLATGRTISVSGDATGTSATFNGSADATVPMTLATVNSNVGQFAVHTVNAKGLTTAATALTGDATSSGATLTLATVNASPQTDTFRKVTVNGKGLTTSTSAVTAGDITTALTFTPVNKAGDTMTGLLILSADPTAALGAATKQYVDGVSAGVNVHAACDTATTAALATCTYNNGTAGVGATLTASTNGVLGTIGGYASLVVADRILVKNQASAIQNGIYVVTSLGSIGTPWVLTRSSDFDGTPTTEVESGDLTYIQAGSNSGTQWVQTTVGTGSGSGYNYVIIGTDNIVFTQFAGSGTYTAGSGIGIATNVISNTGVLSLTTNTGLSTNVSATGNVTVTNTGVTSAVAGANISVSGATGAVTIAVTGTVPTATTATNIAGGVAGNIHYQSAASTTALLATGTSSQVLVSGATPAWSNTPALTGTNFTGIPNGALTNSSVTIGSTNIALGATATTLAGLSSVTSTAFVGALTGNASTATAATNIAGGAATQIPFQSGASTTTFDAGLTYTSGTNTLSVGTAATGVVAAQTGQALQVTSDVSVSISTNGTQRLLINSTGAFAVAGTAGTAGQILASTGSTTPPAWSSSFTGSSSLNVLKTGDTMSGALVVAIASDSQVNAITASNSSAGTSAQVTVNVNNDTGGMQMGINSSTFTGSAGYGVAGEGWIRNSAATTGMYVVSGSASGSLRFGTAGTERARFTSAGGLSFGATGTAYGTSGQVLVSAGNASPVWASTFTGSSSLNVLKAGDTMTGLLTLTGGLTTSVNSPTITSIDDNNANGSNFKVNTTTKNIGLYAFDVQRSATTVGGIKVDGSALFTTVNATTFVGAVTGHASLDLPLTGGTLTGNLTVTKTLPEININTSASADFGRLIYSTAASTRWIVGKNNTAESGSDVGSDFYVQRFTDAGVANGTAMLISRNTGNVSIGGTTPTGKLGVFGASGGTLVQLNDAVENWMIRSVATGNIVIDNNTTANVLYLGRSGAVGISTTSPTVRLQVGDGTSTGSSRNIRTFSTAADIQIGSSATTVYGFAADTIALVVQDNNRPTIPLGIGTISAQPLIFGTNTLERMRIDSNGNVGIGTSTITSNAKLDVLGGDINIQSSKTASITKASRLMFGAYTGNLQTGIYQFSDATRNILNFGGGTVVGEPASDIVLTTGAVGTAAVGTERMRVTSTGGVSFGATGTAYGTAGQVLVSAGNAPPVWSSSASVSSLTVTDITYGTVANTDDAILTTSATTADQVVATFAIATYRSAKFQVQVVSGTAYQMTEINVIHDGTTAFMTEFGTVSTGANLATFGADILTGNLRLLATPANAVTTIKVIRTAITV